MKMELDEIYTRVCKLEDIVRELAKWTNFDIQKFTTSTTPTNTLGAGACATLSIDECHKDQVHVDQVDLNFENQDQDKYELNQGEVLVENGDIKNHESVTFRNNEVDDDLVYKIEVDDTSGEEDEDNKNNFIDLVELNAISVKSSSSRSPKCLETVNNDDELDPNFSPSFHGETGKFFSSSNDSGSESEFKTNSRSRRQKGKPSRHLRSGASPSPKHLAHVTVFPATSNSASLPCPFVSMERLTSTQLNTFGIKIPVPLQPEPRPDNQKRKPLTPDTPEPHRGVKTRTRICYKSKSPQYSLTLTTRDKDKRHLRRRHLSRKYGNNDGRHNKDKDMKHLFHCYFCQNKFKSNSHLRTHLSVHTGEKPLECSACHYATKNSCTLNRHFRNCHPLDQSETLRNFKCPECPGTFKSERGVRTHMFVHKPKILIACQFCPYDTNARDALKIHMRDMHRGNGYSKCYFCGDKIKSADILPRHLRIHTREKLCLIDFKLEAQKSYDCPQLNCHLTFENLGKLKAHMMETHPPPVGETLKPFKCPHCSYRTDRKHRLPGHLQSKHEDNATRPWKCAECGRTFKERSNLRSHLKHFHTSEKPFLCHFCPFMTKTQSQLHHHVRNVHNQDAKYINCYFCQEKFSDSGYLRKHMRVHTGEKPFKCSICPYSAADNICFNAHMKHVHSSDPLRNIPCPKCPCMFRTAKDLTKHVILHGKIHYKCLICPYGAMNMRMLQNHRREVHPKVGVKHQCPQCPKQFKQLHALQQHIRAHTGEKPFKCKKCPYATSFQSNFSKHVKLCKGKCKNNKKENQDVSFPCDECGQTFTNVGNVKRHKSKWHPTEDILKCSRCNHHFKDRDKLTDHVRKRHGHEGVQITEDENVKEFKEAPAPKDCSASASIDEGLITTRIPQDKGNGEDQGAPATLTLVI